MKQTTHKLHLIAGALLLAAAAPLHAAVVLPSVAPGTQYRIAFVTTSGYASYNATTPSQTRSVAYWDGIVNAEADLSSEPTVQAATFHLVGSLYDGVSSINAPTVSGTAAADSIPIYNTRGELIAVGSNAFWSADHTAAMNGDRDGGTLTGNAWAGWIPTLPTFRPFGSAGQTFYTNVGATTTWSNGNVLGSTNFLRVFALSEPITAVPEPSTALLGGVALLGLMRRRR